MTINKNQTVFTVVTSTPKAVKIAEKLNKANRLHTLVRYKNYKLNRIEYYIFYYNYR